MQVDPMKPKLKPPGTKRLKLKCDILLSTSALKFNLRRHSKVKPWGCKDDRQLQQGVHYYLQKARLFSRERMTLEEVAGMGAAPLEDLLDYSSGAAAGAYTRPLLSST